MTQQSLVGPPLRAISVWEPWASLILEGHKRFETRGSATPWRGWVAIHVPSRRIRTPEARALIERFGLDESRFVYGAVIGVAYLAYVQDADPLDATEDELACGWWGPGRFAYRMHRPMRFDQPIPATGATKVWRPGPELIAAIHEQLEASYVRV